MGILHRKSLRKRRTGDLSGLLPFCVLAGMGFCRAQGNAAFFQLPNPGFETYKNQGTDSLIPVGWNSYMNAHFAKPVFEKCRSLHLQAERGGRPGSNGLYCLKLYSTKILGVNANGVLTTGRVHVGSPVLDSPENFNYTDCEDSRFHCRFASGKLPDSLVVWVRYEPKNPRDQGLVKVLIHEECRFRDPGVDVGKLVAYAAVPVNQAYAGWVRYSVPFERSGCEGQVPAYVLATITTNKVPGGGAATMWVDDISFVYNEIDFCL